MKCTSLLLLFSKKFEISVSGRGSVYLTGIFISFHSTLLSLRDGAVFVWKLGGYRGVRSSVRCSGHLELRGIVASLCGCTLAAVRDHHVICLQVNSEYCLDEDFRPGNKREGVYHPRG